MVQTMEQYTNKVSYEWVIEWVEFYTDDGVTHGADIVDLDHSPRLAHLIKDAAEWYNPEKPNVRPMIALVRDYYNERDGVQDRGYAYITENGLEEEFSSEHKVPVARIKAVQNQMEKLKSIPHFAFKKKE